MPIGPVDGSAEGSTTGSHSLPEKQPAARDARVGSRGADSAANNQPLPARAGCGLRARAEAAAADPRRQPAHESRRPHMNTLDPPGHHVRHCKGAHPRVTSVKDGIGSRPGDKHKVRKGLDCGPAGGCGERNRATGRRRDSLPVQPGQGPQVQSKAASLT